MIPSGPAHDPDRLHLHVVCTDPDEHGFQLLLSVSTYVNDLCDQTCILQAYEHEWLKHRSYILYRKARIEAASTLDNGLRMGLFEQRANMNGQTFLRIRNGICKSAQTPLKIRKYYGC